MHLFSHVSRQEISQTCSHQLRVQSQLASVGAGQEQPNLAALHTFQVKKNTMVQKEVLTLINSTTALTWHSCSLQSLDYQVLLNIKNLAVILKAPKTPRPCSGHAILRWSSEAQAYSLHDYIQALAGSPGSSLAPGINCTACGQPEALPWPARFQCKTQQKLNEHCKIKSCFASWKTARFQLSFPNNEIKEAAKRRQQIDPGNGAASQRGIFLLIYASK